MSNWREDALCAQTDPDLFFPTSERHSGVDARKICANCPVKQDCLEFALSNGIDEGVWGGTNGKERRVLLRQGRSEPVRWVGVDRVEVGRLADCGLSVGQIASRMQTTSQSVRRALDENAA